ncbi:MAG TPA: hypothetical protein VE174_01225 [Actinomycetota bacterium]|nr:hypothetical protein [Actinomycetota bacterium]
MFVVALSAFGWSVSSTHSYERDFERWEKQSKPQLMTTAPFSPITAMDYPGEVHTEDRQAQEAGCTEIGPTRKKLEKAAAALPDIAGWPPLLRLNPSYSRAQDRDERRHRLVSSYRAEADKVLASMQRDCTFDTKYLAAIQRYVDLMNDADKLLDPKGSLGGGWTCDYKEGCIPLDSSRQKSYARLMAKATRHEQSELLSLFQASSCERTSMAAACAKIAKEYEAGLKLDQKYNRLIIPGSNSEIDVAVDRADRFWKRFERRSAKILQSQHPGLRSISNFTDDPTDVDAFFAGVAQLKVRDLLSRRATVNNELL